MKEVCIKIKGRVQGVGFRRWAVNMASQIGGISGWVTNVYDGSVEILMKGDDSKLDEFIIACHKGPMFARVDKIEFVVGRLSGFLPSIEDGIFKQI